MKEKVIIITGAGSGIGAATAEHFAQLGSALSLVDINGNTLAQTVDTCMAISGIKPLSIVADVTNNAITIINSTINHFGQLDVLINNAGRGAVGSICNTTLEQYDDMMELNVKSAFHLIQLAVPHLIKTQGNIVNVSSIAGVLPFAGCLTYCMAQMALNQLTRSVALELAPKGVRVNAVTLGAINTNFHCNSGMSADMAQKHLEGYKEKHPLGRVGEPTEVADAIAFLCNNELASFITGTSLPLDGGRATQGRIIY